MDDKGIKRINELSRLSRERELTPEESREQAELRRAYIDSLKRSLVGQLDNTYLVDEKGNKTKLKKGRKD